MAIYHDLPIIFQQSHVFDLREGSGYIMGETESHQYVSPDYMKEILKYPTMNRPNTKPRFDVSFFGRYLTQTITRSIDINSIWLVVWNPELGLFPWLFFPKSIPFPGGN